MGIADFYMACVTMELSNILHREVYPVHDKMHPVYDVPWPRVMTVLGDGIAAILW